MVLGHHVLVIGELGLQPLNFLSVGFLHLAYLLLEFFELVSRIGLKISDLFIQVLYSVSHLPNFALGVAIGLSGISACFFKLIFKVRAVLLEFSNFSIAVCQLLLQRSLVRIHLHIEAVDFIFQLFRLGLAAGQVVFKLSDFLICLSEGVFSISQLLG